MPLNYTGYLDVIKTLTEKNANVNFQEPTSGNTSLHIATVKGWLSIKTFNLVFHD